jgi:hypothetical protein
MRVRIPGVPHVASCLVLLGAAGCKGDGSLWLFLFEPNTDSDETTCETQLTHNFNDASEPDDEVDPKNPLLTVTQELTQNDSAVIGQVTGGSEPVLVIGSRLWLGEKDGSTTGFVWKATEDSTTTEEGDGYAYAVNAAMEIHEKISLEFNGKEASGKYTTTQTMNQSWTETDSWDMKTTGVAQGQIPAGAYLRVEAPSGNMVPAHNTIEEVECAAPSCSLGMVSSCEMSVKVTATEIAADEEDYDALNSASRPAGVPD